MILHRRRRVQAQSVDSTCKSHTPKLALVSSASTSTAGYISIPAIFPAMKLTQPLDMSNSPNTCLAISSSGKYKPPEITLCQHKMWERKQTSKQAAEKETTHEQNTISFPMYCKKCICGIATATPATQSAGNLHMASRSCLTARMAGN